MKKEHVLHLDSCEEGNCTTFDACIALERDQQSDQTLDTIVRISRIAILGDRHSL